MWLIVAFAALGFLIGNLVGLAETSVVTPLLGLLFAFGGGSILAFLQKMPESDRKAASQAVLALSLACLLGVYGGVLVNEYRVLSPAHRRWPAAAAASSNRTNTSERPRTAEYARYVRSTIGEKADEIDARYRNRELTAEAAFDSLYASIKQVSADSVR